MNDADFVINTFSYIWQHPVGDCIARLLDQGFRKFEVQLTSPHLWPGEFDRTHRGSLVRALHAARIVSLNIGGFDNNLASPGANVRLFSQAYVKEVIDLAADLGARSLVMSPGTGRPLLPPPKDAMMGWFRESMEGLLPHAEERNIRLLLENIPYSFLPRTADLVAAIRDFPDQQVGIVFDLANSVYGREDPLEALDGAFPRLGLVHLSDTPLDAWRHDPVGYGVVPFEDFGKALRKRRYSGDMVLEIISPDPDRQIRESLDALGRLGW